MATNTIPLCRESDRQNTSRRPTPVQTLSRLCRRQALLVLVTTLTVATAAHAQSYYYVDCSGANPADFSTISAALAVAGPNSYILVTGTCNENVSITNSSKLSLGAFYGSTATIHGNVSITASNSVFLYGLNVTNPAGDGFDIASSHNVTLWTCTANGNAGVGLSVNTLSDVAVLGPGSFNSNGASGILVAFHSVLDVLAFGGAVDISGNHGAGVGLGDGGLFQTLGNTTIENNINVPGGVRPDGFGIQAVSVSKVQVANCFGTNQISGNQSGGIDVREHSQVSIWSCGPNGGANIVKNNGPVGIEVGMGSQLALYENVAISGHTGSGIDLYGEGQLYMHGPNLVSQNGSSGNPRGAGVVVDGNSEAYLRGGTISSNEGPGILALVNSSVDSVGATFADNTGGMITCDSSAYLVSDLLPPSGSPPGIACRTPHRLGNGDRLAAVPVAPDFTAQKNQAAQYKKFASPN